MSNVAAVLLMYLNEEDAFWAMVVLIGSPKFAMHGMLIPGLPKLLAYCDYHKTMRKRFLPKLDRHFVSHEGRGQCVVSCDWWQLSCACVWLVMWLVFVERSEHRAFRLLHAVVCQVLPGLSELHVLT